MVQRKTPQEFMSRIQCQGGGFVRLLERHTALAVGIFSVSLAALCITLLITPGKTYVSIMLHDTFLVVDNAYRIDYGQIPHVDFHTAFGGICYLVPYIALKLTRDPGAMISLTLALSAFILIVPLIYVLSSRFRWELAILITLYLIILILAPMILGESPRLVTMAMWYNRVSWAAIFLLFLCAVKPKCDGVLLKLIDGCVMSFLLSFLVYTKISYGVVSIVYMVLMILMKVIRRATTLSFLLSSVFVVALVEILFGLHIHYYTDVMMAINASSAIRGGISALIKTALMNLPEVLLFLTSLALLAQSRRAEISSWVLLCFIGGSSIALLGQNAELYHLPGLVAGACVAAGMYESGAGHSSRVGAMYDWRSRAFLVLVMILIAQPVCNGSVVILRHFSRCMTSSDANLVSKDYEGLVVNDRCLEEILERGVPQAAELVKNENFEELRYFVSPDQILFQTEYLETVRRGRRLLEEVASGEMSVFVFDMNNPFLFLSRMRPPKGTGQVFDVGRNFTYESYFPADDFFSDVDVVMVPTRATNRPTRDALLKIYGDYLERHYARVPASDGLWTVWIRKEIE